MWDSFEHRQTIYVWGNELLKKGEQINVWSSASELSWINTFGRWNISWERKIAQKVICRSTCVASISNYFMITSPWRLWVKWIRRPWITWSSSFCNTISKLITVKVPVMLLSMHFLVMWHWKPIIFFTLCWMSRGLLSRRKKNIILSAMLGSYFWKINLLRAPLVIMQRWPRWPVIAFWTRGWFGATCTSMVV